MKLDLGTYLIRSDPQQTFRELEENEIVCITSLLNIMAEYGSDFTDTFRIIGDLQLA